MEDKQPELKALVEGMADTVADMVENGPLDETRIEARRLYNLAVDMQDAGDPRGSALTMIDAFDLVTGVVTLEEHRMRQEQEMEVWHAADLVRVQTGTCPICEINFNNAGWTTFQDEHGKLQKRVMDEPRGGATWHKHSTLLSAK